MWTASNAGTNHVVWSVPFGSNTSLTRLLTHWRIVLRLLLHCDSIALSLNIQVLTMHATNVKSIVKHSHGHIPILARRTDKTLMTRKASLRVFASRHPGLKHGIRCLAAPQLNSTPYNIWLAPASPSTPHQPPAYYCIHLASYLRLSRCHACHLPRLHSAAAALPSMRALVAAAWPSSLPLHRRLERRNPHIPRIDPPPTSSSS